MIKNHNNNKGLCDFIIKIKFENFTYVKFANAESKNV